MADITNITLKGTNYQLRGRLYTATGQNANGAMTQKATTDALAAKATITVTSTDPGEGSALAANNFIAVI